MKTSLLAGASLLMPGLLCAQLPLISIPDFNGDGAVNAMDQALLQGVIDSGQYNALFDLNADGDDVDADDMSLFTTKMELSLTPTTYERQIIKLFTGMDNPSPSVQPPLIPLKNATDTQSFGQNFLNKTISRTELFQPFNLSDNAQTTLYRFTEPFWGHGYHYLTQDAVNGFDQTIVREPEDDGFRLVKMGNESDYFNRIDGLTVDTETGTALGAFWGVTAIPLFYESDTSRTLTISDYPESGGEWQDLQVACFLRDEVISTDSPPECAHPTGNTPNFFAVQNVPDNFINPENTELPFADPSVQTAEFNLQSEQNFESWHAHGGMCLFIDRDTLKRRLVQFTTYNECMSYFSTTPNANRWTNFWMIHAWIFKLNPDGLFANTHPDVSTTETDGTDDYPFEGCISARAMPQWFRQTYITGDRVARVTCNEGHRKETLPMAQSQVGETTGNSTPTNGAIAYTASTLLILSGLMLASE